jgi:hypothetical protein
MIQSLVGRASDADEEPVQKALAFLLAGLHHTFEVGVSDGPRRYPAL